ncbi:hypothetical protein MELB17_14431 [Marinobacter sp. ELB17]|nr:hypothetical protein MELB17_14431 [Marinobacter sp. ELB17]
MRVQIAYDTEIAEEALEDQLNNIRPGHVLELFCVMGDDHQFF